MALKLAATTPGEGGDLSTAITALFATLGPDAATRTLSHTSFLEDVHGLGVLSDTDMAASINSMTLQLPPPGSVSGGQTGTNRTDLDSLRP